MTTHRSANLRRGFTLVEVLVVVGVIALLAALTVGAIAVFGGRAKVRSTEGTLVLLDAAAQEYVGAVNRPLSFGSSDDGEFDLMINEPNVFSTTHLLGRIGDTPSVQEIVARIEPRFVFRYNESVDADGDGSSEVIDPEWILVADPADPNDPGGVDARAFYQAEATNGGELDGKVAILDAWGTPIRAVHHGPTPRAAFGGVDGQTADPSDDLLVLDPDGTYHLRAVVLQDYLMLAGGTDAEDWAVEAIYGRCRDRRVLFVSAGPDRRFGDLRADPDSDDYGFTLDNVYSYPIDRTDRREAP